MLKIVIFTADKSIFEYNKNILLTLGVPSRNFVFADSTRETRLDVVKKFPQTWLFFLDHDCLLNAEQYEKLNDIYEKYKHCSENLVIAGKYTNSSQSGVIQKAHNWIANTWLELSYEGDKTHPMLLGGVFLIYWKENVILQDLGVGIWGAEDKYSATVLKKTGFRFVLEGKLEVEHNTSAHFRHFIKRAYLHGVNDVKYFSEKQSSNLGGWIRKIDFLNVGLVSLVLLHFFVQKASKIIQKTRQLSRQ